jgi:ankyrin repeat protein
MLQYLIQIGIDPNAPNYFGYTPVYQAIQFENIDDLKILIKNGVTIDTANPQIRFILSKANNDFITKFNNLFTQ